MKSVAYLTYLATALLAVSHDATALSIPNNGRRDAIVKIGGGAASVLGFPSPSGYAWAASDSSAPIAVLGASGKTGALCVSSLLRRGLPVLALTRSGSWPPPKIDLNAVGFDGDATSSNPLLTIQACDVKNTEALTASLSGCRAAIYAASASKKGGNSKEIDGDGVIAAGNICLQQNVGRYVVISSGSTTRPNSLGFKFTELAVAGIMTQKRRGEVGVRDAYSNQSASYTILRPGGLDEPKQNIIQGPSALEITQGDVLAGFVSRADVAEVAVELALSSSPNVKNTAIELYYGNKVVPVDKGFKKYLQDGVDRLHGDTYDSLFQGVKPNYDYLIDA